MPLSENEQRILRQIEQQLEKDPTFSTRGYRIPRRRTVGLAFAARRRRGGDGAAALGQRVAVDRRVRGRARPVASRWSAKPGMIAREKIGALPISAWLGARRRGAVVGATTRTIDGPAGARRGVTATR